MRRTRETPLQRLQRAAARQGPQRRLVVSGVVPASVIQVRATALDKKVRNLAGPLSVSSDHAAFSLPDFAERVTVTITHEDYLPFEVTMTVEAALAADAPTKLLAVQKKLQVGFTQEEE